MRTYSLNLTSFLRKMAGTQENQGLKPLSPGAPRLTRLIKMTSWATSPGTNLWTHWALDKIIMRPVCSEECCKCSRNIMSTLKSSMELGMKCSDLTRWRVIWFMVNSSKIFTGSSISEWRLRTRSMFTSIWSLTPHSKKLKVWQRKLAPTVTPI